MATNNGLNGRFTPGFTTQAGANFTAIPLTASSTQLQVITGTAIGASFTLPTESTMPNGYSFTFINSSSGGVAINSSGLGAVLNLTAGGQASVYLVNNSVTTAAAWNILSNNTPAIMTGGNINPTITFGGSSAGMTYNNISGQWRQIVNNGLSMTSFVINVAWLTYSGVTAGNFAMTFTGLAIPSNSVLDIGLINAITYANLLIATGYNNAGTSTILLRNQVSTASSGANYTTLTNTNFNSASQFQVKGYW